MIKNLMIAALVAGVASPAMAKDALTKALEASQAQSEAYEAHFLSLTPNQLYEESSYKLIDTTRIANCATGVGFKFRQKPYKKLPDATQRFESELAECISWVDRERVQALAMGGLHYTDEEIASKKRFIEGVGRSSLAGHPYIEVDRDQAFNGTGAYGSGMRAYDSNMSSLRARGVIPSYIR